MTVKTNRIFIACALLLLFTGCKEVKSPTPVENLKTTIAEQLEAIDGDTALVFYNLSNPDQFILMNADEAFHAASTMKVPVMIEMYKQVAQGKFQLSDSIVLKNEFKSIVDGSLYTMDVGEDSDDVLYKVIGEKVTLYDLMYYMITVSSNLATNVLIDLVDAKVVTATMRELGADRIEVLRGVEDQKAYDLGLSNSTTARDLMVIMEAIAKGKAGNEKDCQQMINILKDQKFNDMIPLHLPKDISVAHKTGAITGVHHDAAIVYLPDGRSYVLVLLSKNLKDFYKGTEQLAQVSKTVFDFMMQN